MMLIGAMIELIDELELAIKTWLTKLIKSTLIRLIDN